MSRLLQTSLGYVRPCLSSSGAGGVSFVVVVGQPRRRHL